MSTEQIITPNNRDLDNSVLPRQKRSFALEFSPGTQRLGFFFYLEEEYNSISYGYLDYDITNTRDIMQEIAMNVIWSEEEYNSMTDGYLDYDTTMTKQTVCKVSLTIEM